MRSLAPVFGAVVLVLCAADGLAKEDPARPAGKAQRPETRRAAAPVPDDAARRAAAVRGLEFLARELPKVPDAEGTPRKPFTQAVAGLCRLLDPRTADTAGSHLAETDEALRRYVAAVERRIADPDELPDAHGSFSSDKLVQYTWPLAMTAVWYAELHERNVRRPQAKDALQRIARILAASQDTNGGWGHGNVAGGRATPDRARLGGVAAGGYPSTLVASSALVGAALGLTEAVVGRGTVQGLPAARTYFRAAPLPEGLYPYDPSQRSAHGDGTSAGRTAGALWAWHCLGMPRDAVWGRSRAFFLDRLADVAEGHGSPSLNVLYGALAARSLGDEEFLRFRREVEPRILERQGEEGAFSCICRGGAFGVTCDSHDPFGGRAPAFTQGQTAYTTALHTLVLLLPDGRLRALGRTPEPAPGAAVTPR